MDVIVKKMICFTPKKFDLEGNGFKNLNRKLFKRREKARNSFLQRTINTLAPGVGMAVGAKSKNPQVWSSYYNFFDENISW